MAGLHSEYAEEESGGHLHNERAATIEEENGPPGQQVDQTPSPQNGPANDPRQIRDILSLSPSPCQCVPAFFRKLNIRFKKSSDTYIFLDLLP